jgi:hypothetical protein
MLKFIIYVLFFYLLYRFIKVLFLAQGGEEKNIRDTKNQKSSLSIDKSNVEDAKFKDINGEQ